MTESSHGRLFRVLRACARLVCLPRRYRVIRCGEDASADHQGPVVYVSRHQNLFGPTMTMMWFPGRFRIWVYHVFINPETSYQHFVNYTFTQRFGWSETWAKIVAWPLSYGFAVLLRSARCIPVYRGSRQIIDTLKQTVQALQDGCSVFIFPDVEYQDASAETGDLYKGFLQLDKYVQRATGQHVRFVPVYVSRRKRAFFIGDPICFRADENFQQERNVVYEKIRDGLNRLAAMSGELVM